MSNIIDAFNRRFSTESEGSEMVGNGEGVAPEQNDSNVEISPEGETLDASDTLEGQHAEAESAEVDVDEATQEHEAIEQTAEAVESFLVASIEARQAGQYWSAQTAAMTERGLQAVVTASGGNGNFRVRQLSGENFSDRRDAESAMISFENAVTDMLKNLWQKLKDMLKKIYRKVRDFFTKHFSAVGMLKKRAEAIKKKAQNLDRVPGSKKITFPNLANMHIKGAPPSADEVSSAMGNYTSMLETASSNKMASKYEETLDKVTDAIDTDADADMSDASLTSIIDGVTTFMNANPASSTNSTEFVELVKKAVGSGANDVLKTTALMPGNVVMATIGTAAGGNAQSGASKTLNDAVDILSNSRFVITNVSDKSPTIKTDKEVSPYTVAQIIDIATQTVEFCETSLQFKNAYEKYEKYNDRFIAKMDKIANSRNGNDGSADQERDRTKLARAASAYVRNNINWIKSINSHGVRTGSGGLNMCNASLNAPRKD